jgi:DNA polymerase-3 subunit delta'
MQGVDYPDNWGLIGHEWAVALLANQLAVGRISHAYLFAGLASVGKTTLAIRLSQAINCTGDIYPCGKCRACTLIGQGIHPDVHLVAPEGTSIKIEAIRDLQGVLALSPVEARYRTAMILQAERATPAAHDALLKTLEEPPPSTCLMLVAEFADSLPPTIASRCQVIALRPVPAHQIERALAHRFPSLPSEQLALIARLAGGRPGWALTAAQHPNETLAERTVLLDKMLEILRGNRISRFAYAEELARMDDPSQVLYHWQAWWRDVLLLAEGSHVEPVNIDRLDDLRRLATQVGARGARHVLQTLHDTLVMLPQNVNVRLALEVMLLEMPRL